MRFKKIFVAIDFSPSSDEALRQAHERALSYKAQLAVCHIIPDELRSNLLFPHLNREAALNVTVEVKRLSEAVSSRVVQVTGRTSSDFVVSVNHGIPYAEILNAAEQAGMPI